MSGPKVTEAGLVERLNAAWYAQQEDNASESPAAFFVRAIAEETMAEGKRRPTPAAVRFYTVARWLRSQAHPDKPLESAE